jgi:hypothetical protein
MIIRCHESFNKFKFSKVYSSREDKILLYEENYKRAMVLNSSSSLCNKCLSTLIEIKEFDLMKVLSKVA